ncbi:MAG: aminotransferase class V-fold PLP-dependent enzyme [Clostridia bacterium]|nr:aminotransferase class V-fold PLP-dependent enzyme [Clostridia bacterium]
MYSFKNDYSEGAHPSILEALAKTNLEQTEGYCEDHYCEKAKTYIKHAIGVENIDIHFFVGGTQTNLTALSAFLRPHEAVIAVDSGHVCVHETGAIEATGHKVIALAGHEGKLRACDVESAVASHTDEHMVKPKLVYISNSTEIGTIYTKAELTALHTICRQYNLLLYVDGARLASALTSKANDMTLKDLTLLSDAFYIGATKNGALFGEALVITNDILKADFRYHIKQKGGLLAKGHLLGIQYMTLFQDSLYFDLGQHANDMADLLRTGIAKAGYNFLTDAPSNQIFPIFPEAIVTALETQYAFYRWSSTPDSTAIRLVTSWATKEEEVLAFISFLNTLN